MDKEAKMKKDLIKNFLVLGESLSKVFYYLTENRIYAFSLNVF